MNIRSVLVKIALLAGSCASAAEVNVVSTVGVRGFLEQARAEFERSGGHRLNISYGTAAVLKRQLDDGESFDVAILPRSMIDDLASRGKVAKSMVATIARSGIGIAVKAGANKPDVRTREALRGALLAATGISYTKEGQSGAAAARVFDVLGISAAIGPRVYLENRPAGGVLAVAEGRTPLGVALMSEIAADSQVTLAGPLPADLQTYVVFAAGVSSGAGDPEACRAFIAFLRTPAVRRELSSLGLEGE